MDLLTIILILLAVLIIGIIAVLIYRTMQFPIPMDEPEPIVLADVDGEEIAKHLGLAIQLKTVNNLDPEKVDPIPFKGLHNLISTLYPEVEEYLKREIISDYSLLYTWQGSDPELDPIALTAHMDVVPADESPNSGWTYPPFSGTLADGYVWGRGALDCKNVMISILEAVNYLLKSGFQPKRTIYLAFGEDEEISGVRGAGQIVKTLKERGVHLSFLLDEGGTISKGMIPGVDAPIGLVGIAEKGHLSLLLRASTAPGHASAPGETTSIGALALAIATLENNPFPQDLDMAELTMSFVGAELPFMERMMLANRWLFGSIVKKRFAATASTNAVTRTTMAPTIINGGNTENVLPAVAEATINIRPFPGDTLVDVYKYVNELVGDDVVEVLPAHDEALYGKHSWDPTEISDIDSPHFPILLNLIKACVPGALAAPFLMTGATDARQYLEICDRVFRFSPMVMTTEDQVTVHGINERISYENLQRMVGFMVEVIEKMSSIPTDFFGEEDRDDEEEKVKKAPKKDKPLKTRPMKKAEELVEEALEDVIIEDDYFDDAPLETRPMKKEDSDD